MRLKKKKLKYKRLYNNSYAALLLYLFVSNGKKNQNNKTQATKPLPFTAIKKRN